MNNPSNPYPLVEDNNMRAPNQPQFINPQQVRVGGGQPNMPVYGGVPPQGYNMQNPYGQPLIAPNNQGPQGYRPPNYPGEVPNQGEQIPKQYHGNMSEAQRKFLLEQRQIVKRQLRQHPRAELPENNETNLELGGAYQQWLFKLGECTGQCQPYCPCLCCCIEYPYRQVSQSYEGIFERFGQYVKTVKSGLHYINPCTDTLTIVDCQTITIDLPRQWAITQDNIMVSIDACVYYRVINSRRVVYSINNIREAVSELTFATLRSVIGHYTLQELLEKRGDIIQEIEIFVESHVQEWGIDIENMAMQDIVINQELQETLSMAAKEKRLAESKIISAQSDVASAKMLREAADILDSNSAMQIRYLQTVKSIGQNSKVIFVADDDS